MRSMVGNVEVDIEHVDYEVHLQTPADVHEQPLTVRCTSFRVSEDGYVYFYGHRDRVCFAVPSAQVRYLVLKEET